VRQTAGQKSIAGGSKSSGWGRREAGAVFSMDSISRGLRRPGSGSGDAGKDGEGNRRGLGWRAGPKAAPCTSTDLHRPCTKRCPRGRSRRLQGMITPPRHRHRSRAAARPLIRKWRLSVGGWGPIASEKPGRFASYLHAAAASQMGERPNPNADRASAERRNQDADGAGHQRDSREAVLARARFRPITCGQVDGWRTLAKKFHRSAN